MTSFNLAVKFIDLVAYCEQAINCPFYSEALLPDSKQNILKALRANFGPDDPFEKNLDKFIPHGQAFELAELYQHVLRKQNGLDYVDADVKKYWKLVHRLYGVDERLDQ